MNYKNFKIKQAYEISRDKHQFDLNSFPETKGFQIHIANKQNSEMQKGKKMVDINEVAPIVPLFEGAEKIEKKDVVGKQLIVEAYAELTGDDGRFGVIKFIYDGKTYSTSINEMMLDRVLDASNKVGVDAEKSTQKEKVLAQTIEVTIVEKQSEKNKNRSYFTFE